MKGMNDQARSKIKKKKYSPPHNWFPQEELERREENKISGRRMTRGQGRRFNDLKTGNMQE